MQQSLFDLDYDSTPQLLDMPDASVTYYPAFLAQGDATNLLQHFLTSLAWQQDQVTLYGKTFDVPRLQVWYGDEGADYQYSNMTMKPKVWDRELKTLKGKCEVQAKTTFNSVLANLYRDGQDGVGRHADDEPELGKNPIIASISLGEVRNLDFFHNTTKQKIRLPLAHGSLLLMSGSTQHCWQHSIAKTNSPLAPRINLTFRYVIPNSHSM